MKYASICSFGKSFKHFPCLSPPKISFNRSSALIFKLKFSLIISAVLIEKSLKTVVDGNQIAQSTNTALEEIAGYIEQILGLVDIISEVAQKEADAATAISEDILARI